MKQKPLVSILINNYNYGQFLSTAIDSVLDQAYKNIEIIVVDDGSTDNSREIINSYGEKIIAVLKKNGGQASAFNAGFVKSKGNIICFLDADDLFFPNKISEVVKAFATYQKSGWCFHPVKIFNKTEKYNLNNNRMPEDSSYLSEYNLCHKMQQGKLGNPLPFSIPATSGMCFSRYLIEKLLPMPEAEKIILNDSYLKFAAMGISQGIALDMELAGQRIHDSNAFTLKKNDEQLINIYINTAYWLKRNFPSLSIFADNLLTQGIGRYWHSRKKKVLNEQLIKEYLSIMSNSARIRVYLKSFYVFLKIFVNYKKKIYQK